MTVFLTSIQSIIPIQPPMMSSILTGVYTYPKAKKILETCEEIVNEREKP